MWKQWKRLILLSAISLALSACGEVDNESKMTQGTDTPSVVDPEVDNAKDNAQDNAQREEAEVAPGQYQAIFSDPETDQVFVTYHTRLGLRLFGFDAEQGWSEVLLPEPLQDEPTLRISSIVSTEFDLLISTHNHGPWQLVADQEQWRRFAPQWLDDAGHITRLQKIRDQVYAFNEVLPDAPLGVELWKRNGLDWRYMRSDMFMIIDYIPRPTVHLRSTRYGTVEISHDHGDNWAMVPGVFSDGAPKLFEWHDDVIVATTSGVWGTDDDGQNWQRLSEQQGRVGTIMDDDLIVGSVNGQIGAIDLVTNITRDLPELPVEYLSHFGLAASGQELFVITGDSELLKLSPNRERWEFVDPAGR